MSKHRSRFLERATALFEYNIATAVDAVVWLQAQPNGVASQVALEQAIGKRVTQVRTVCVIMGWIRVSRGRGPKHWVLLDLGRDVKK